MTLEFTPAGFDAFQNNITDVSTLKVGTATSTGTANQALQVGTASTPFGAYISGNLGIGTINPTSKLHVQGDVRISGVTTVSVGSTAAPAFQFGSSLNGIHGGVTNTIDIVTNGTTSFRVDPDQSLVVAGTVSIPGLSAISDTNTGIYFPAEDTLAFVKGGVEAVRITSVGNVLIGSATSTGTASQPLQVTGNTYISGGLGIGVTNNTTAGSISVGGSITVAGQYISTRANNTATGAGQIYLNGATGNRIDFNVNGVAAPAFTTRSAGTKLVLYPAVSAAAVDYGFGIDSSTLWSSVPTTSEFHRWYAGTTNIATLSGVGNLSVTGGVSGTTGTFTSQLQIASPSTYSGITSIAIGLSYPINCPEVNAGSGGFTPFMLQRTLVTGGYRQVLSMGSYRSASGTYSGSACFIAPGGGSDNNPTDYFLLSYGGSLSYSGGSIGFGSITAANLLVGSTTPTGTASQPLQITGGAYVSGNLGVGVTTPVSRVHIQSAHTLAAGSQIALIENITTGQPASLAFLSRADNAAQGNEGAIYFDAGSSGVTNDNRLNFTAAHQDSISPQMTLTGAGNIGIGTGITFFETRLIVEGPEVTSPGLVNQLGPLHVYNSTNNADTVPPKSALTIGRDGKSSVSYGNYVNFNLGRYSQTGTSAFTRLTLRLNNGNTNDPDTDVITFLASGRVGIGITNPTESLNVIGDIALGVDAHVNQGTYYLRGGDKLQGVEGFNAVSLYLKGGNASIGGGAGATGAGNITIGGGDATKYEASNGLAGNVFIRGGTVTTGGFGGNVNPGYIQFWGRVVSLEQQFFRFKRQLRFLQP